jgi:DNA polymerase (family 10)
MASDSNRERPTNKDIVHLLKSVAAVYLLKGANRFRMIAYQKAADAIEPLTQEVYDIWQNGQLNTIQGLGPSLQAHLDEYFQNPKGSYLEKQLSTVPAPVFELMRAPGIGPMKAFKIVTSLNLKSPETVFNDVRKAASNNKIAELESFGEKSQNDILKAIDILEERGTKEERMTLPIAIKLAEDVTQYLKRHSHVKKVEPMGSLRRRAPTIGDIDLLAVVDEKHMEEVVSYFVQYPHKISIEAEGMDKGAIMASGGRRVDLRVVPESQYGSMIQYFTGSKAHNIKLREIGLKKGYSLNEFGIKEVKTGKVHSFITEEGFYSFLGLDCPAPEIREGYEEIKLAMAHKLPNLVEAKDIRGDFHIHSSFDVTTSHDLGEDPIEVVAQKAYEIGYEYIAFSEHNPARGKLTDSEITDIMKRKREAIEAYNKGKSLPIHIFNSLEIDIQPDGSLALPESAFQYLDLCIVSLHSSFRMSKTDMTQRILKAFTHPKVKIMGHPTGRLLGKREEVDADWPDIIKEAKKRDIALEINASPDRLDLPEGLVRQAVANGNKLVINTDAHAARHLDGMEFGVYVARRGWAEKSDIMNAKPLKYVMNWLKE